MPLRDHFREPLDLRARWQSFSHRWATALADFLDRTLPPRFYAQVEVNLGTEVGADVAEFERLPGPAGNGSPGAAAVETYAPPIPAMELPAVFPEECRVRVRDLERDSRLAAVVELVSPSNKDRPESRHAFAAKLIAYFQIGVGVVIVDVVTNAHFNLHNECVGVFAQGPTFELAETSRPYAVAYRPVRRGEHEVIDVWPQYLVIGGNLPLLPLALRGYGCVPLDLEGTYQETCQRVRLK